MEQHPVPQHIASYEFRLVGDMTIKQFGFLAGGVLVALVFYASPLPRYFKWPAIVFFSFLGFALAFLPVQERPLSQWIVAFAKAVFSPTQYIWQKKIQEPELLSPRSRKTPVRKKLIRPADQAQLAEYLKTLPAKSKDLMEQQEEGYLQQVTNLFQLTKAPTLAVAPEPITPPPSLTPRPLQKPPRIKIVQPQPKPKLPQTEIAPGQPPQVKKGQPIFLPEKPGHPQKPTVQVKTGIHLPIPAPPTQPNILVGMVLDKNNELIEGALLEIRNSQRFSVRALKTNKLGQFRIAYPLKNDTYEIETEKEGFQFDIIKIKLKGEIVPPIEIRAK